MRSIYFFASIPCAVAGCTLSALGGVATFAGDLTYTLAWALLQWSQR